MGNGLLKVFDENQSHLIQIQELKFQLNGGRFSENQNTKSLKQDEQIENASKEWGLKWKRMTNLKIENPLNFSTEWIFHFKIMKVKNPLHSYINKMGHTVTAALSHLEYLFFSSSTAQDILFFFCLVRFSKVSLLKENNWHLFYQVDMFRKKRIKKKILTP